MITDATIKLFEEKLKFYSQNTTSDNYIEKHQILQSSKTEKNKYQQKNKDKQLMEQQGGHPSLYVNQPKKKVIDHIQILKDPKKRHQFTNLLLARLGKLHNTDEKLTSSKNLRPHHKKIKSQDGFIGKPPVIFDSYCDQNWLKGNLNKLIANRRQPSISSIDNLLILLKIGRPSSEIKLQIKRQSIRQNITFNKILVALCIQQLVSYFYDEHQINMEVNQLYLYKKIGEYLNKLIIAVNISNWYLIRRIVRAAIYRIGTNPKKNNTSKIQAKKIAYSSEKSYNLLSYFTDSWLGKQLNKCKKQFVKVGIDYQNIMITKELYLSKNGVVQQSFIDETPKGTVFPNFRQQFPHCKFYDSEVEEMHDAEEITFINKLKYFQNKSEKQKRNNEKVKNQKIPMDKIREIQKKILEFQKQPEPIQFQISIISACIPPHLSQICLSGDQESQDFYETSITSNVRGKKQKLKQKIKEKQMKLKDQNYQQRLFRRIQKQQSGLSLQTIKNITKQYDIQFDEIILPTKKQKNNNNLYPSQELQKIKQNSKKFDIEKIQKQNRKKIKNKSVIDLQQSDDDDDEYQGNQTFKGKNSTQIVDKMERILIDLYQKQQNLTIKMLKEEIYQILQRMSIPEYLHSSIWNQWIEKFDYK